MPGTAMAEAFQEAGFYEGTYDAEGGEGQPAEEQPAENPPENQVQDGEGEVAQEAEAGDTGQAQAAGDDTLENIVEDLKRKNASE
jgi:hypothetical protein